MQPNKPCKWCSSKEHYQTFCRKRPQKEIKRTPLPQSRKPIKKVGKVTNEWLQFRKHYLVLHPPDEWGYYDCYLQTAPLCPKRLLPNQVTLDHKIPRGGLKGANLKFNEDNIAIACSPCNTDKGSMSLENYLKSKE